MQLQRLSGLERKKIEDELRKTPPHRWSQGYTGKTSSCRCYRERWTPWNRWKIRRWAKNSDSQFPSRTIQRKRHYPKWRSHHHTLKTGLREAYESWHLPQHKNGGGCRNSDKRRRWDPDSSLLKQSRWSLVFHLYWSCLPAPNLRNPQNFRTAKGSPIVNFISLQPTESISTILNAEEANKPFLFFATTDGTVKRLERTEITNIRSSGLIVMKVEEGNNLIGLSNERLRYDVSSQTKDKPSNSQKLMSVPWAVCYGCPRYPSQRQRYSSPLQWFQRDEIRLHCFKPWTR